ncbi:MAG: dihydrofolate reductase family protein [Pirellulaceae bacterium]
MNDIQIVQCFPVSSRMRPLAGLYLEHCLHLLGGPGKPMVYGNFLTSLDGRIALGSQEWDSAIPKGLGTPEDWHLLQELEAQADCIIVHGGYLRALQAGRLGNILQVGMDAQTQFLQDWRVQNGLKPQPDILIVSASLNFPLPPSIGLHQQRVIIATGTHAATDQIQTFREKGFEVWSAGNGRWVEGRSLVRQLNQCGYQSIYLLAGPRILASMAHDRVLSRLYLTLSHCLVGGDAFHTLFHGKPLPGPLQFKLESLYYQAPAGTRPGQFYNCFSQI